MLADRSKLTPLERFLTLFTRILPGEGNSILLFFVIGFVFMFCQWMLKPLREIFILEDAPPEMATYATGVIAALLMIIVPLYSVLFKHQEKTRLVQIINLFFAVCLVLFYLFAKPGLTFGFIFFVWVGIFSVMMITQFWALAADHYNVKSGQRLFAVLAAGVSLGGWIGSRAESALVAEVGPRALLLITAAVLVVPLFLIGPAAKNIPECSRSRGSLDEDEKKSNVLGGFDLVFRNNYLRLIAVFVILQNFIDTTGDFILRSWIQKHAQNLVASGQSVLSEGATIGVLYGDFYGWMNLLTLLLALLVVSRVIRFIKIRGAMMVVPILMILGYGLIAFVPVFAVIRLVKLVEKSSNYSLNNTVRAALFLPISAAEKYEGKTTIDTFFWRFGDLITAGAVAVGIGVFDFQVQHFAIMNILVAVLFLAVSVFIGKQYSHLAATNVTNLPPEVGMPIPDVEVPIGQAFRHALHPETFFDPDQGDVLVLTAQGPAGVPLPAWLKFDTRHAAFHGTPPQEVELTIEVIASDVDGASVSDNFVLRCVRTA